MVKGRDRRELIVGAMARPWGTAREPFWGGLMLVFGWLIKERWYEIEEEERIEVEEGVALSEWMI